MWQKDISYFKLCTKIKTVQTVGARVSPPTIPLAKAHAKERDTINLNQIN